MRRLLLSSILLLSAPLAAQPPRALQPAQLQQDFDVLTRALEEAHGGLHRFTAKPELDRVFAAARANLNEPMTSLRFASVLSEALAAIHDGHTRLEYDDATTSALASGPMLPLRVALEDDRLIITANDTPADSTILPGMELMSINGRPTTSIVKAIAPKLSGDGFIETGKRSRLARSFAQNYWLYVEQATTFTVVARSAAQTVTTTLKGVTSAERASSTNPVNTAIAANVARLDGSRDTIALSFPQGEDIGVLRIRAFDGTTFISSLEHAIATLREKRAKGVILDLRGNGGGVDMYGAALVSQFLSGPFRYFDRIKVTTIKPSFATWKASTFDDLKNGTTPAPGGGFLVLPKLHPGVSEQPPATAPFPGKLVALIDGGTFSTSADVCAQLRSRTNALFVGEETGGAAEGNTSGLNAQVVLPNSQLKLKVQMYGYWNALGPLHPEALQRGRGTMPDVSVLRTTADNMAGVDTAVREALTVIRR
jgi:hypothetical protein